MKRWEMSNRRHKWPTFSFSYSLPITFHSEAGFRVVPNRACFGERASALKALSAQTFHFQGGISGRLTCNTGHECTVQGRRTEPLHRPTYPPLPSTSTIITTSSTLWLCCLLFAPKTRSTHAVCNSKTTTAPSCNNNNNAIFSRTFSFFFVSLQKLSLFAE